MLDGVRLQASRPPGDVRTGPEPWVIPYDTAVVSADRRWKEDRLFAGIGVSVTAWGRSAVPGVRVELKGAAEGRAESPWLTPGERAEIVVPVRLDRLSRLLQAGVVESRLRWDGGDQVTELVVSGDVEAAGARIELDGWEVVSAEDGEETEAGSRLPNGEGWRLAGEWEVPASLEGRSLTLVTTDSPADYSVNGVEAAGDSVTLCSRCSRGTKLVITATTTGAWERMPVVQNSDASGQ
jgi:hypothetical protein